MKKERPGKLIMRSAPKTDGTLNAGQVVRRAPREGQEARCRACPARVRAGLPGVVTASPADIRIKKGSDKVGAVDQRRPGRSVPRRAPESWSTRSPARRPAGPRRGPERQGLLLAGSTWERGSVRFMPTGPGRSCTPWPGGGVWLPEVAGLWPVSNNALELPIRHRIWLRTSVGARPAVWPVQVSCRAARKLAFARQKPSLRSAVSAHREPCRLRRLRSRCRLAPDPRSALLGGHFSAICEGSVEVELGHTEGQYTSVGTPSRWRTSTWRAVSSGSKERTTSPLRWSSWRPTRLKRRKTCSAVGRLVRRSSG